MTKLSQLKPGDNVHIDGGFTCMSEGFTCVEHDTQGLFVRCKEGRHYLDGCEGTDGTLVGIKLVERIPKDE